MIKGIPVFTPNSYWFLRSTTSLVSHHSHFTPVCLANKSIFNVKKRKLQGSLSPFAPFSSLSSHFPFFSLSLFPSLHSVCLSLSVTLPSLFFSPSLPSLPSPLSLLHFPPSPSLSNNWNNWMKYRCKIYNLNGGDDDGNGGSSFPHPTRVIPTWKGVWSKTLIPLYLYIYVCVEYIVQCVLPLLRW